MKSTSPNHFSQPETLFHVDRLCQVGKFTCAYHFQFLNFWTPMRSRVKKKLTATSRLEMLSKDGTASNLKNFSLAWRAVYTSSKYCRLWYYIFWQTSQHLSVKEKTSGMWLACKWQTAGYIYTQWLEAVLQSMDRDRSLWLFRKLRFVPRSVSSWDRVNQHYQSNLSSHGSESSCGKTLWPDNCLLLMSHS